MEHAKGLRTYIAPNDTLCAGMCWPWPLWSQSGGKISPPEKRACCRSSPTSDQNFRKPTAYRQIFPVAANIYKDNSNLKPYHWCDLSKRCLPNKSQARLQDGSHSSGYHGMWLVSNLSLKRGPIGWASYLFWAWCPRHIVLSNIQVLTASCSNLGDLPNFANAILKFVCSSLDQHIFAISWPCEGDHVWSCHIMSIHLGCAHLGVFIHCPQQETLVSTVSSADKLLAGHRQAAVEEKACLAFTNRWQ